MADARFGVGAAALSAVLSLASVTGAQPANDDCANATAIGSLPFSEVVDTTLATNDNDASGGSGTCATFDHSVWYAVTAGASDILLVVDAWEGSAVLPQRIAGFGGTCGALGGKLGGGNINVARAENLAATVPAGGTVRVCVGGGTGGLTRVHAFEAPEFLVDPEGYDAEFYPNAAAANAAGDFLVLWSGWDPVDDDHLRSRVFGLDGTPVGPQIVLDDRGPFWMDAAALGASGFVAVWDHRDDVLVQLFDDTGAPIGASFAANQTPGNGALGVASDAAGNFVVAWEGPTFRRFDSNGTPLGNEQTVAVSGDETDVGRDAAGNFVIVWENGNDVLAQRYDPSGSALGGQITVSSGYAYRPYVASAPGGEFLVVWERDFSHVQARAYDASGNAVGAEFEVSEPKASGASDHRPRIHSDAAGNFVVAWEDDDNRSNYAGIGISARRLDVTGTPRGPQFSVNTINDGYQFWPAIGVAPGGEFTIAWGDTDGYPWATRHAITARGFEATAFLECPGAPVVPCRATVDPGKSKLLLRNDGANPDDLAINWKWVKGAATAAEDFGDPLTDDDVFFCLYDDGGGGDALVTQAALPAGGDCGAKPCWKGLGAPVGSKGFKYKDKERTPNGVLKAVLKPGLAGRTKVVFKAGRGNLATGPAGPPPTIPITGTLTAQLHVPATGECWGATFTAVTAKRNSSGIFQAASD